MPRSLCYNVIDDSFCICGNGTLKYHLPSIPGGKNYLLLFFLLWGMNMNEQFWDCIKIGLELSRKSKTRKHHSNPICTAATCLTDFPTYVSPWRWRSFAQLDQFRNKPTGTLVLYQKKNNTIISHIQKRMISSEHFCNGSCSFLSTSREQYILAGGHANP